MDISTLHTQFLDSSGICIDSRKLKAGNIFFAIKGDRFDGHEFVAQALKNGAKLCVIENSEYEGPGTVLVSKTIDTLQKLANFHRRYLKTPILAITGSNGKTTTKELCQAVLSSKFKSNCTQGNLNNHLGVPLTLLSFKNTDEFGIVEMGANHIGEIKELCEIAEPDFGMITNIGKAHLEGFGGPEGVIKAKSELYQYLISNGGHVFCNQRDELLISLLGAHQKYSFYDPNDFDVNSSGFELTYSLFGTDYQTHMAGTYNIPNIAAALELGRFMNVPSNNALKQISAYVPKNNRSQILNINGNHIFLDAYNANPSSMRLSIDNFIRLKGENKILLLGDMLELGEESFTEHVTLLKYVLSQPFHTVYTVGKEFLDTGIKDKNLKQFVNIEELKPVFPSLESISDHLILIKGSRGIKLEQILPAH